MTAFHELFGSEGFLHTSNHTLEYRFWTGENAPLIVCFHGLGESAKSFSRCAPQFANAGYNVLSISIPFHGKTTTRLATFSINDFAAELFEYFDLIGIRRFRILAHSFGARLAVTMAVNRPDSIRSLILVAPGGFYAWEDRIFKAIGSFPLNRLMKNDTIAGFGAELVFGKIKPAKRIQFVNLLRTMSASFTTINFRDARIWEQMCNYKAPVHLILGKNDRLLPESYIHEAKQHFPDGKTMLLDEMGHRPMVEKPVEFAAQVLKAMASESLR